MTIITKHDLGDILYYLKESGKGFGVSVVNEVKATARRSVEFDKIFEPDIKTIYVLENGDEVDESEVYTTKEDLAAYALAKLERADKHLRSVKRFKLRTI